MSWFKQTVYDPSASLSAERRGTMSLPDPESFYACAPGEYRKRERKAMLKSLERKPDAMWPTTWSFSFRNPAKVYGSPWLDDAIGAGRGEAAKTPGLLRELARLGEGGARGGGGGGGGGEKPKEAKLVVTLRM